MKIIGIYGIDGSGKTTQIGLLKNALRGTGHWTEFIQINSTARTAAHRIAWLNGYNNAYEIFDANTLLVCGALDALRQVQSWNYGPEDQRIVIIDRYIHSYKATSATMGYKDFSEVNRIFSLFPKPTIQFFLQIDCKLALKRIKAREKGQHDVHSPDYLKKYNSAYLDIIKDEPGIHIVNGEQTPEEIHSEIFNNILSVIK